MEVREFRLQFGVDNPEQERKNIERYSNGVVDLNWEKIAAHPDDYPCCLGCSGLRYVDAPTCYTKVGSKLKAIPGCQPIYAADVLMHRNKGTCIDLACLEAALKRHDGDAGAHVQIDHQYDVKGKAIPGKYHAICVSGDGVVFDPQRSLEVGGCSRDNPTHESIRPFYGVGARQEEEEEEEYHEEGHDAHDHHAQHQHVHAAGGS